MMMVALRCRLTLTLRGLTLEVLLDRRKILLGSGQIAGLEVFAELAEGLRDGIAALR